MTFKEKFIDPQKIDEVITLINELSRHEGFDAVLAGGVAMQVYGSPRLTKDVDFVVDREPRESSLRKIKALGIGGYRYQAPNGAMVDLILRSDEYEKLYQDAIDNAEVANDGTRLITPEFMVAVKLAAGRPKDVQDFKWIVQRQGLLDLRKARSIVYKHLGRFGQDRFEELVDQALLEKEQSRRKGTEEEGE